MRTVFLPKARAQLKAIYDHIALDNETAAHTVVARVEQVSKFLADNPLVGRELPRGRLRRFPVKPYPYLIYYEVTVEAVRIVRIRHSAQYRKAMHETAPAFAR